ncbi:hypothetical protein [Desulfobacter vibrioformis]|uniref:hypothetical protein n=1 Tax=Desulfobacter vibrioformis TaxID=34031 RepID=UPI0006914D0C|nr:hypothetical protein [Desulfobacter vibrioformis]
MDKELLNVSLTGAFICDVKAENKIRFEIDDTHIKSFLFPETTMDLGDVYFNAESYDTLRDIYISIVGSILIRLKIDHKLSIVRIPSTIYYNNFNEKDKIFFNAIKEDDNSTQDIIKKGSTAIIPVSLKSSTFTKDFMKKVQTKLYENKKLKRNDIDGVMGKRTELALNHFRIENGLKETKGVNFVTLSKLKVPLMWSDIKALADLE